MAKFYYDSEDLGYEIETVGLQFQEPSENKMVYECQTRPCPAGQIRVLIPYTNRPMRDRSGNEICMLEHARTLPTSPESQPPPIAPPPPPPTPPTTVVSPPPSTSAPTRATPPARVATPAGVTVPRGFYVAQKISSTLPTGAREVPGHNDLMFYPNPTRVQPIPPRVERVEVPPPRVFNIFDSYIQLLNRPR